MNGFNMRRSAGNYPNIKGVVDTKAKLKIFLDAMVNDSREELTRGDINIVFTKFLEFLNNLTDPTTDAAGDLQTILNNINTNGGRDTVTLNFIVLPTATNVTNGINLAVGVIPDMYDGWKVSEANFRGVSDTGNVDVTITFVDGTETIVASNVEDANTVVVPETEIFVAGGDLIRVDTAGLSGTLTGLMVSVVLENTLAEV